MTVAYTNLKIAIGTSAVRSDVFYTYSLSIVYTDKKGALRQSEIHGEGKTQVDAMRKAMQIINNMETDK